MPDKKIRSIRESIAEARTQEAQSNELQAFLSGSMGQLHPSITLPSDNPSEALHDFVIRYIEHVPDFLEALTDFMKEAEIFEYGKMFIDIAEDFFLKPPELVGASHSGMHALIDEAYLSHRLIEEVNDRLTASCGSPLAPMDMTLSNIIIHELLGDEFANQLDLAVHYAIESLFNHVDLEQEAYCNRYIADSKDTDWNDVIKKWPCLAGDSAISLNIESEYVNKHLH